MNSMNICLKPSRRWQRPGCFRRSRRLNSLMQRRFYFGYWWGLLIKIISGIFFVFCLCLSLEASSRALGPVRVLGPDWSPYYYQSDNKVKGYCHKIMKAVLKKAKVEAEFILYPWARAYTETLKVSNTVLCGLGRTPEREGLVYWIGPTLTSQKVNVYKLKSNKLRINNSADLLQHKIGVLRLSYSHEYLKKLGLKEDNMVAINDADQLTKVLYGRRVPLIIQGEKNFRDLSIKGEVPLSEVEVAYFAFSITEYIAISKGTPVHLVEALQESYQALEAAGELFIPDASTSN